VVTYTRGTTRRITNTIKWAAVEINSGVAPRGGVRRRSALSNSNIVLSFLFDY
jgi:hypothetical protein